MDSLDLNLEFLKQLWEQSKRVELGNSIENYAGRVWLSLPVSDLEYDQGKRGIYQYTVDDYLNGIMEWG